MVDFWLCWKVVEGKECPSLVQPLRVPAAALRGYVLDGMPVAAELCFNFNSG